MNRRQFLHTAARATALSTATLALAPRRSLAAAHATGAAAPTVNSEPGTVNRGGSAAAPNILLLMADDLNHWVGPLHRNPQTQTPNIDRFATQALTFTHACCPASVCNPSRCAFMSGLHPSTTGVYGNPNLPWQNYIDEAKCLNGFLRANGYTTIGAGKIYHIGGNGSAPRSEGVQWDTYATTLIAGEDDPDPSTRAHRGNGNSGGGHAPIARFGDIQAGPTDAPDSETGDYKVARWAAAQLGKTRAKPFFMAIGFHKPHLPFVVPKPWFDKFPLDQIQLPPHIMNDADDLPPTAKRWANSSRWKAVYGAGGDTGIKHWKQVIQAYLAAVAYTDAQFGTVLDALDRSPHAANTIVILMADHGWHFGEKQHFGKTTLWEESARVPFLWRVPNLTPAGATCTRAVETLSLFPTLCELANLPAPGYLEGVSIKKLLADPAAEWTRPALTTYGYKNHSVRTEQWRYTRYADNGEELYNELDDPYEWRNLANDPQYATIKKTLAKSFPAENTPDKAKAAGKPARPAAAAGKPDITPEQAQRRAARRAAADSQ